MSEEPLAHKNQPPDVEYDSIYATMAETAQGRRFLEEHARRSAPSEPDATLAAIQRMQAAMGEADGGPLDRFLLEMAEIAQAIARTRVELGQIDSKAHEFDSIVQTLRSLEDRIQAMLDISGKDAAEKSEPAAADDPCITGSLGQADVDAVMQPDAPVAEEDRQDATLEDINRFMLALEPLMALHQAATAEKATEQDATIVAPARVEEPRPELSTTATVMQEAEDARARAEWMVEGASPDMQALSAPADMTPSPAEPEAAEQAWMVLQRLQTTPDFPQPEPEAEPAAELSELAVESEAAAPVAATTTPPFEEIIEEPPAAAAPVRAETTKPLPILSVATPQDEIIARLTAMLPPAELNFPKALAKAADIAAPVAAPEPQIASPVVELPPAPPEPEAAETAPAPAPIEAPPPATTREEATFAAAPDFDTDEFLFAPETTDETKTAAQPEAKQEEAPADFLLVPAPPQVVSASAVTPPKAKLVARAPYDPLAPLRALSDEEKIALFS